MKRRLTAVLAAAAALGGCASSDPARVGSDPPRKVLIAEPAEVRPPKPAPALAASPAAVRAAPASVRVTPRPVARKATPSARPRAVEPHAVTATHAAVARAVVPRTAAASPVDRLRWVGTAKQVVVVQASGYGTSYATLTAYQKTSTGWVRRFGPWTARIGRNGFAPSGAKREGDGRTPTGGYGFSFFFGVNARPSGIHYAWRHAYSYDVWDDDPSSARYNLWTDTRSASAGRSPEPMHNTPSYNYAAVIAYNTARTRGLGSAIFFHVSHGSSTAGCVALPQSELLPVLRWLNPSAGARIIMGTRAAINR